MAHGRRSSGTAGSCEHGRQRKYSGAPVTRWRNSRRRKDLQPDDQPRWIRDRLRAETRDLMIAGHFPHLPRLLALLITGGEAGVDFPLHGVVALVSQDEGATWRELWRLEN